MRSARTLALVGAAVLPLPALVGAASARHGTALPRAGIAVETRQGVDLIDLDGHLRRSLPGFRFRGLGVERPGQVELRDRSGRGFELRAGALVRAAADTVTLGGGYALRFRRRWALLRAGKTVERFAPGTHVELDGSGTVLTAVRLTRDGRLLTPSVARDLRSGVRRTLPSGCRVGVQSRPVRFELCNYPYGNRRPSTIVRVDERGRRTLTGPAERHPRGPAGSWQSVMLSPDGRRLLAQWLGECEIPTAYLIDARTGRSTVLGRDSRGRRVESRTLGWNGDTPLVALPRSVCTLSADRPGVYAFDRRGHARLIYPLPRPPSTSVRLWR